MAKINYPDGFLKLIHSITNKRAKIVIDHILEYGFITTETIENTYGYKHPPRAARDVREAGIPLETFQSKSSSGKTIAAYKFGDLTKIRGNRLAGRQTFSKKFKKQLYQVHNGKCAICNTQFALRYFQIDHKVPYEVIGDIDNFQLVLDDYMLVCASCNRTKSWSCEQCANWRFAKDKDVCLSCYWGNPNDYEHVALENIRRLELVWKGDEEVKLFENLQRASNKNKQSLSIFLKDVLSKFFRKNK